MARMSIDDMFLRDSRVMRFAHMLGMSKFEACGRLLHVFALAYDRADAGSNDVVTAEDIDFAAEKVGVADAMIMVGLAQKVGSRSAKSIRIKGAKDRTEYLATRRESGRAGGVKSGETRRNRAEAKTKHTFAKNEAPANPSAPDLPSADPDPNPTHTKSARARGLDSDPFPESPDLEAFGQTADEIAMAILAKLGSHNGVEYSGTAQHKQLIADRLRDGITVDELRMVIGYCAIELGWRDRPEMLKSLRPETLFGDESISKYLDPARTWFKAIEQAERARRAG
jgi:uncharacterized phage protein (TIGR02220 family)